MDLTVIDLFCEENELVNGKTKVSLREKRLSRGYESRRKSMLIMAGWIKTIVVKLRVR